MIAELQAKDVVARIDENEGKRKAAAKASVILFNKVNNPSAPQVKSRETKEEGVAKVILFKHLPTNLKRELKGMDVHEMWAFIETYGENQEFEVVDKLNKQLQQLKAASFLNIQSFTESARDLYLRLKDKDPEMMTKAQFLRLVLTKLPSTFKNEKERLYKLLREDDLTWDKMQMRLVAAEPTTGDMEEEEMRPPGGQKQGKEEENTNTALLAQVRNLKHQVRKLKKSEKALFTDDNRKPSKNKGECFNFRDDGSCPFGGRCHFLHGGEKPKDSDKPKNSENRRRRGNPRATAKRRRDDFDDEREREREEANLAAYKRRRRNQHHKQIHEFEDGDSWGLLTTTDEEEKTAFSVRKFIINALIRLLGFVCSYGGAMLLAITVMLVFQAVCISPQENNASLDKLVNYTTAIGSGVAITSQAFLIPSDYVETSLISICANTSAASKKESNRTVIDGGATTHVITSRRLFKKMYDIVKSHDTINMNSHAERIVCRGSLDVYFRDDKTGKPVTVTLHNVAYVPSSLHNLFSISAYLDSAYEMYGFEAKVVHRRKNTSVSLPNGGSFTGPRMGNLFYLLLSDDDCVDEEAVHLSTLQLDNETHTPTRTRTRGRSGRRKRKRKEAIRND